jgi:hypothetical protein
MPQPNKGSAGKPNVSQPIVKKGEEKNSGGPKGNAGAHVMFGAPGGKGTRGSK